MKKPETLHQFTKLLKTMKKGEIYRFDVVGYVLQISIHKQHTGKAKFFILLMQGDKVITRRSTGVEKISPLKIQNLYDMIIY